MLIKSWLSSAFVRNYPKTPAGKLGILKLEIAKNEQTACQLVCRNEESSWPARVEVAADSSKFFHVRIRRVGYVPMPHFNIPVESAEDCEGLSYIPGLVPDPLFEENSVKLPPQETHTFWLSIMPRKKIEPGQYKIRFSCKLNGQVIKTHTVEILVHNIEFQPRKNFQITHWFYTDAIMDWYKTDGYDNRFWDIFPAYVKNLTDHCQDTLFVPLFTPPLDGVKTPCQLLKVKKVGKGKYSFDFSDVRKYIQIAKQCGIKFFEWSHLVTQWGAKYAINVYQGQGKGGELLWRPETPATSNEYKVFLSQLLPRFYKFLKKEKLLEISVFHLSDEPHGEEHLANYKSFREHLKGVAPWMKIMDAMSDVEFAKKGLIDTSVSCESKLMEFFGTNVPCWVYYCCNPRGQYLNHLLDTPLAKIAMHGLLCYRFDVEGFLHWGYNFWYRHQTTDLIDPFTVSDAGYWPDWAYGDTFLVYPGVKGPIDSIRWEVIGLAFQDYQLLQTAGISRDDKLLNEFCSYKDFPKSESVRKKIRSKIFASIAKGAL